MINETEILILKELIKDLTEQKSILEISKIINRPYSQTHQNIKKLEKKELIKLVTIGKTSLCVCNYTKELITTCYIESLRTKEFLEKNKKIQSFFEKIKQESKTSNYTIILFGKSLNETQTKNIDIAIITNEQNSEELENISKCSNSLSLIKINIKKFTYDDLSKMLNEKKEINTSKEIIKNHIILTGYEKFYKTLEQSEWERSLIKINW